MKQKPFYSLMMYPIQRSKYNPLYYIFGKWTITNSLKKYCDNLPDDYLDTKDIKFIENNPTTSLIKKM